MAQCSHDAYSSLRLQVPALLVELFVCPGWSMHVFLPTDKRMVMDSHGTPLGIAFRRPCREKRGKGVVPECDKHKKRRIKKQKDKLNAENEKIRQRKKEENDAKKREANRVIDIQGADYEYEIKAFDPSAENTIADSNSDASTDYRFATAVLKFEIRLQRNKKNPSENDAQYIDQFLLVEKDTNKIIGSTKSPVEKGSFNNSTKKKYILKPTPIDPFTEYLITPKFTQGEGRIVT